MVNKGVEKVAIFGSCIPNGVISTMTEGGSGMKITKANRKNLEPFSLVYSLKQKYEDVTNFAHSMSGMSYVGCGTPTDGSKYVFSLCTGEQILNTDLSDYSTIIIVCNGSDYKNTTKEAFGKEDDETMETINGAWNLVLNKLKSESKDKNILFFLPLYLRQVENNITYKEFNSFLIKKIEKLDFKYFSFYDYLSSFVNIEENEKFLFPDGFHPSFDVNSMFVKYVMNILEKEIGRNE